MPWLGLALAAYAAGELVPERIPTLPWGVLLWGIQLFVFFRWVFERKPDLAPAGCLLWVAVAGAQAGLAPFRDEVWSAPAAGVVWGLFFWARGKGEGRPDAIAAIGAALAGIGALAVGWENGERYWLATLGAGLSAALQGLWIKPGPAREEEPVERSLVSLAHAVLGRLDSAPATMELDRKVRQRYEADIAELGRLGFDFLCSETESIALYRLVFGLPLLVVANAAAGRQPMALTGGRVAIAYPVFVARNRSAFAELDGRQLKVFTELEDGGLLVSGNYHDAGVRGPGIERSFAKGAFFEACARHQGRVGECEAAGRRFRRLSSYQDYSRMSARDSAAW